MLLHPHAGLLSALWDRGGGPHLGWRAGCRARRAAGLGARAPGSRRGVCWRRSTRAGRSELCGRRGRGSRAASAVERWLDLRYAGAARPRSRQSASPAAQAARAAWREAFGDEHARRFGYTRERAQPVEIVTARVRALSTSPLRTPIGSTRIAHGRMRATGPPSPIGRAGARRRSATRRCTSTITGRDAGRRFTAPRGAAAWRRCSRGRR